MIPAERVPFAVMNAAGLDATIADLCAPFEPDAVRPDLYPADEAA